MITKEIVNAGLTGFYPVVVLIDNDRDMETVLDGRDYSDFSLNEGMSDREIMEFSGVI
jgi:hypothetical protein